MHYLMLKMSGLDKGIIRNLINGPTLATHWSVIVLPLWTCKANSPSSGARYEGWKTTSQSSSVNASTIPEIDQIGYFRTQHTLLFSRISHMQQIHNS